MFTSRENAQRIVDEMKESIHRDINIMDERGVILASTNPARISQVHGGALKVLREGLEQLSVRRPDELEGTQEGINLPICLGEKTVGVIGITGNPDEVGIFGSVIKRMTEIMIESTWQQERENQLDIAKGLFLENWLFSDTLDLPELEVRGRLLNIDVSLPRTVILLQLSPSTSKSTRVEELLEMQNTRLLQLIRRHIGDDPQNFCAAVHQRILILLRERSPDDVRRLTGQICSEIESFYQTHVSGGVSSASETCMDLRRCYLEAKTASRVAAQSGRNQVLFYHDVSLDFAIQSIAPDVRRNLVSLVFSSCTQEERAEILDTLRLYFKYDGNTERAAEEAYVHRNTLQYRINKIQRKTGYSLRSPTQSILLYLALQFAADLSAGI